MNQEAFKRAHLAGMRASPFRGDIIMHMGPDGSIPVADCVVKSGDNQAQVEEYVVDRKRTLSLQVPKVLPRNPSTTDVVEYKSRKYAIESICGEDDASPVWVIKASAPK